VWIAFTATAFRFGVDEASKALFRQLVPAIVAALFVGHAIARWGTTRVVVAWVTASAALLGPLIAALTIAFGDGSLPLWIFAGCTATAAAVACTLPPAGKVWRGLNLSDVEPREEVTADLRAALRSGTPLLAAVALAAASLGWGALICSMWSSAKRS